MANDDSPRFTEQSRWYRWGAAVLVLVIAFIGFLVDRTIFQTCGDELMGAGVSVQRLVSVCSAAGVTDFPVLALVLVIGLLVLPDFSEIGFGQVLTLKTRVDKQAAKQVELDQKLAEMNLAVTSARATAGADSASRAESQVVVNNTGFSLAEGVESSVKSIVQLQADMTTLQEQMTTLEEPSTSSSVPLAEEVVSAAKILWVDDKPGNNVVERYALDDRGHFVLIALSTNDALRLIDGSDFDLMITDMGRTENGEYVRDAGIRLMQNLRARGITIPFLVYSNVTRRDDDDDRVVRLRELGARISTSVVPDVEKALRGD